MAASQGSELNPEEVEVADNFFASVAAIGASAVAGYVTIRYNLAAAAPFSIAGGMKSVEYWQKTWRAWDAYKANKANS